METSLADDFFNRASTVNLRFHPLRFSFVARESVYFPPGKSANVLRGAFGSIFRKIALYSSMPQCGGVRTSLQLPLCPNV